MTSPEEFERICDTFVPSPRKLSARDFGRFARAWDQPRTVPAGYDEAQWLAGWDEVDWERNQPDTGDWDE